MHNLDCSDIFVWSQQVLITKGSLYALCMSYDIVVVELCHIISENRHKLKLLKCIQMWSSK